MKMEIATVNIVSKTNFREIIFSNISALITIDENKIRAIITLDDIENMLKSGEFFVGESTFVNIGGTLLTFNIISILKLPDNSISRVVRYSNY